MSIIKRPELPEFPDYFEEPLKTLDGMKKFFGELEGKKYIADSAKILEYSVIKPPCYIGENTVIGPLAHIRPYTIIDDNCAVGTFSVVKESIILEGTHIPHLNYVGDSIIGRNCNLGAGTKTANLRFDEKNVKINYRGGRIDSGRKKLGVIFGDDVKVGINASTMPGAKIGSGCRIGAGVVVDRDLEENTFYGYRKKKFLFFSYYKLVKEKIK